jgi:hypothetical protein
VRGQVPKSLVAMSSPLRTRQEAQKERMMDTSELQKQIYLDGRRRYEERHGIKLGAPWLQDRPPVVGAERAEDWIKRRLVERAKLRAKVVATAKKILKGEAKAKSGA